MQNNRIFEKTSYFYRVKNGTGDLVLKTMNMD